MLGLFSFQTTSRTPYPIHYNYITNDEKISFDISNDVGHGMHRG